MDMHVRFRTQSVLNNTQSHALTLLADHGSASAGGSTGVESGQLVIHRATALVLVRYGFAEANEDGRIAITDKGLRKLGRLRETPAQRKARKAKEALGAQASGKWKPAPPGASAQAERDAELARREWAEALAQLNSAQDEVNREKEMLRLTHKWAGSLEEIRHAEEQLARAEVRLDEARATRDRLAEKQKRAA